MKKKNCLLVILVLLFTLILCSCGQKKTQQPKLPKLVIGSDNYIPFNYLDENNNPTGIDVELAKEACKRMGYTPVFQQINWDEKEALLKQGKIDCLWGCFSMNGREEQYQWAGPYMNSRQIVAVRYSSSITDLMGLTNKKVAVQISSKPEEILTNPSNKYIPQVKNLYSFVPMDEVFSALRKGYVDACAGHESTIMNYIYLSKEKYRIIQEPLLTSKLGVAFAKSKNTKEREQLDKVLRDMHKDGTIKKIQKKYKIDVTETLEGIQY